MFITLASIFSATHMTTDDGDSVSIERYTPESVVISEKISNEEKTTAVEFEQINYEKKVAPEEANKLLVQSEDSKQIVNEVKQESVELSSIHHTSTLDGLAAHYNTYKMYYRSAANCHPYILASIHYRETNFGNTNGWNGQGVYQNIRNRYPTNSVVTDWEAQTIQACEHLRQSVGWATLNNLDDFELVGAALASYNGCNNQYYKNCSYVVNKTNLMAQGTKCSVDFSCLPLVADNRYGALSIVSQLRELNL